jgi:adenylate cyclase
MQMQRRLTTVVAIELARYVELMAEAEEDTIRLVSAIQRLIVGPLRHHYRGRVFYLAREATRIEFSSDRDALRFALDVLGEMRKRAAQLAGTRQIQLRIAIHRGDVCVAEDGDLLGNTVNVAVRLCEIADSGGILLSRAVYDHVHDALADVAFLLRGDRELKDIPRPYQVYSAEFACGS